MLRKLVAVLVFTIIPASAFAQCNGQAAPFTICGNNTASQALPSFYNFSPLLNAPGGTVLGNPTTSAAAVIATIHPILGIPGASTGQLGLAGATSGTATITPQSAAGTPTLTLPNTSGTFAVNASAPLALSSTTGNLSVTGAAGQLLAGSTPAFTATPTLGVAGTTVGTLSFDNLTSGSVTLQPTTGALGSSTLTIPAITDTIAGKALANGGTNASLTASNGGLVYSTASAFAILSGTATANQIPLSGSNAAPSWSTATYPATTTINQLLYSNAANTITGLATANGGLLNTSSSGVPSITSTPTLGVAGTSLGTLTLAGNTSGSVLLTPQAAAGTTTLTLPNTSGTVTASASAPLSLNTTTGNVSCPTCATATLNGAALTTSNDTNVTATLGGTPSTALLNATSITMGWSGTLSLARGGLGGSQSAATANQIPVYPGGGAAAVPTSASTWLAASGVFGNPTATIGLTAVNGSATTAMRSDGAPALSQSIAPTWTGLHTYTATAGGLEISGNPSSVLTVAAPGLFGSSATEHYAQLNAVTAAQATAPEFGFASEIASAVGAGNVNYYKVAGGFVANENVGSAPMWAQTSIINLAATLGNVSGTVSELDLNNQNKAYTPTLLSSNIYAANLVLSGSHCAGCYGTTGILIRNGQSTTDPMWDTGITFGIAGYLNFHTSTINDIGNAPVSYTASGKYTTAIMNLFNTNDTSGDQGIALGVGLTGCTDTTSNLMAFYTPTATAAGTIKRNDSAGTCHVAYNTSSDERLKRDRGLLDHALDRVKAIKVHKYVGENYSGGAYAVGFFAQELYKAYPWAVSPSTDPDYHKHPWQVDYGQLTPLLVAAMQEQQQTITRDHTLIARLEAKIDRLSRRKHH